MDADDGSGVEHPATRAGLPVPGDLLSSPEVVASRRGFIKSGLAAGSIVLSVVNRPAWAKAKGQDTKDKGRQKDGLTESAAASSTHLSHHPRRA